MANPNAPQNPLAPEMPDAAQLLASIQQASSGNTENLPPWIKAASVYMQEVMKEWEQRPPQEGDLVGALHSIFDGSMFLPPGAQPAPVATNPAIQTLQKALQTVSGQMTEALVSAASTPPTPAPIPLAPRPPSPTSSVISGVSGVSGVSAASSVPSSSASSASRFPVKAKRARKDN